MPSPGITKLYMAQAMKELMADKPLSKISVGDIVKKCELNRNSFYYHFKDKYDLVNWIFSTEIMHELGGDEQQAISGLDLAEKVCNYFYDNKDFYINALSVEGQNSFSEYFAEMLKALIASRAGEFDENETYREFYIDFFTDAFLAALFRWLRGGAQIPPDEFAVLIRRAVQGAAANILDYKETS